MRPSKLDTIIVSSTTTTTTNNNGTTTNNNIPPSTSNSPSRSATTGNLADILHTNSRATNSLTASPMSPF